MGSSVNDKKSYVISGHWDPCDPVFAVLNQETPKDRRVFMTVAIDLVIRKFVIHVVLVCNSIRLECTKVALDMIVNMVLLQVLHVYSGGLWSLLFCFDIAAVLWGIYPRPGYFWYT